MQCSPTLPLEVRFESSSESDFEERRAESLAHLMLDLNFGNCMENISNSLNCFNQLLHVGLSEILMHCEGHLIIISDRDGGGLAYEAAFKEDTAHEPQHHQTNATD